MKIAKKLDFIDYINIFFNVIINLILFIFLSFLLGLSFIIIYLSQHEDEFSVYLTKQITKYGEKYDAKDVKVTNFNADFTLLYFEISADEFEILIENYIDVKTKNVKLKVYYLPLFLLKLKSKIDGDFVYINYFFKSPSLKSKSGNKIDQINFQSFLLFFRSIKIQLNHFVLDYKEKINLTDFELVLKNENKQKVLVSFNAKAKMFFDRPENKTDLQFHCAVKKLTECDVKMLNLNTIEIDKITNIIGDKIFSMKEYFEFQSMQIKEFVAQVILSENNHLKNLVSEMKFDNFIFKVPFLDYKNVFDIKEGTALLTKKNEQVEASFDFILQDDRSFAGNIKYNKIDTLIEITGKNFTIEDVQQYWPNKYLKEVKIFLQSSIEKAKTDYVKVYFFNSLNQASDLSVTVKFYDADFKYSDFLPKVQQASGIVVVDNENNVKVELEKAVVGNIETKNTVALFDIHTDVLNIKTDFTSEIKNLIIFFMHNSNTSFLNEVLAGDVKGKLTLKLPIVSSVQKSFENVQFNADLQVSDFTTPLAKFNHTTKMNLAKNSNSSEIKFSIEGRPSEEISTICHATINSLGFNLFLNLESGILNFDNILAKSDNVEIAGTVSTNYHKKDFLNFIDFEKVKFCKNDFSFFFNPNTHFIQTKGDTLDLPELQSLKLHNYIFKNKSTTQEISTTTLPKKLLFNKTIKTLIEVNLENLFLYNNIHFTNVKIENNRGKFIDILAKKDGVEFVKVIKNNSSLIASIEDSSVLLSGFNKNQQNFAGGKLHIMGKVTSNNIEGTLQLKDYTLLVPSGGSAQSNFDFSSKEMKGSFKIDDEKISISNLRFTNIFHTLTISGDINRETENLDLTAIYTPSSLDVNNLLDMVYLKDFFNTVTFGMLEQGLLSLVYDVTGTVLEPTVTFNGSATSGNLAKTGTKITTTIILVNIILIPFIGVLLLIF